MTEQSGSKELRREVAQQKKWEKGQLPVSGDEHVPRHEDADAVKQEDDVDELVFVFGHWLLQSLIHLVQPKAFFCAAEIVGTLQRHNWMRGSERGKWDGGKKTGKYWQNNIFELQMNYGEILKMKVNDSSLPTCTYVSFLFVCFLSFFPCLPNLFFSSLFLFCLLSLH